MEKADYMTLEGLWIVKFTAAGISGSGVAVFCNGKVFGGETGFYYIGTYRSEGKLVKAHVGIHNFDATIPSGFGIGDYEMDVSAMWQDETNMNGTAIVTNRPQYSMGLNLTKKANL